ncbi:MAG: sigma-54-dependent Fis family transcriptional regulator [Planctomycetes bacterium]|nr:sigma-54-dependent Fis family transcriptional regulator [Planctomycetota bacterium]
MSTVIAGNILVVDDEKLIRWSLKECLRKEGYHVNAVESGNEALQALEEEPYDLVLLDYKLPDTNGLELLEKIKPRYTSLPVVMITSHSSVENAVAAMRAGASDYITKPFQNEDIVIRVAKVLENYRLRTVVAKHQEENFQRYSFERIIGQSKEMSQVIQLVKRIVNTGDTTILITGESGTGKDILAKAIHYNSPRANGPYINITCTAIPESLLESILFGHEKGSFTDAKAQKKGLLEEANGGTVFLDEIGDMTLYLQAKLLRFLEEKTFQRVGGNRDILVDVRVIAATNKDLKKMVNEGHFREDLYFRLKVIPIHMPPLRERTGDIPLLVDCFIKDYNREFKKNVKGVAPDVLKQLEEYHWPGNIRELKNTIERAMILGSGEWIEANGMPLDLIDERVESKDKTDSILKLTKKGIDIEKLEEDLVRQALQMTGNNQTKAGRLLGLNRDQIRYRIEKFHIELDRSSED